MHNETFFEDTHYEDQMREHRQSGYYITTANLKPVVEFGTIKVLSRDEVGAYVEYRLDAGALEYTNDALIAWCGGGAQSGAVVVRYLDAVRVSVRA